MTAIRTLLGIVLVCFILFPRSGPAQDDWVFLGGAVYTVDADRPWAEAVAVRDGRIAFVGDDAGATAHITANSRVVRLGGRMVLPGFHDSHTHPMAAGTRFLRCDLYGLEALDAVLEAVARCREDLEPGAWLRAIGLDDAFLNDDRLRRDALDAVTGALPAVLSPHLTRWVWVNSAALAAAGIGPDTPDPDHGHIRRDPHDGNPTGVLEDEALGTVWDLASHYAPDELRQALRLASRMANGFGITTANEASASAEHVAAYRAAEAAGEMSLRVHASLRWDEDQGMEQLETLARLHQATWGPRFRAASVKLFLDGSSAWTGAVLEPWPGSEGESGTLNFGPSLPEIVTRIDAAGMDLHFHAWGDRAVREALDAMAQAFASHGVRDRRPQIAHLALVHAADLPRFQSLGVTADLQPLWAHAKGQDEKLLRALGPARSKQLVPVRSLFDAGARVVAGSDWISESMNPLVAIQYAVTRRPLDGHGPVWNPRERVSLERMLAAYTINGAWLARLEQETGSIEVGKAADLVVLDRNLFTIEPAELHRARVLLTLLQGEVVHEAEGLAR